MSKAGPMLNIGGDEKDTSYRYKMPPLITKVEGRGNGIKTILVNITDVCKHLHTEPQYATRFFGIECGAVSKWDDKRDAGIVHGVHERAELQKLLKKFIRAFILCPKCHLPELQMKVQTKKSILMIRCASCGHKGKILSTHKVRAYMINHPPKSKPKGPGAGKRPKTSGRSGKGGDSTATTDAKEDAKDSAANADMNALGGANDEKWSVDVSDEAVARRRDDEMRSFAHGEEKEASEKKVDNTQIDATPAKEDATGAAGAGAAAGAAEEGNDSDDETNKKSFDPYRSTAVSNGSGTQDSGPAQILREFLNEKERKIYEILDEIKRLGLAHGLDEAKQMKVTFEATCKFETTKKLISSLKKNTQLFKQLNSTDKKSFIFFSCLEEIIAKRNPDLLLPKTYIIFEAIYDSEIATEDQILAWYETESDKSLLVLRDEAEQVRKMALPFIKWLQESDEDESEEDESEGDDVVDIE